MHETLRQKCHVLVEKFFPKDGQVIASAKSETKWQNVAPNAMGKARNPSHDLGSNTSSMSSGRPFAAETWEERLAGRRRGRHQRNAAAFSHIFTCNKVALDLAGGGGFLTCSLVGVRRRAIPQRKRRGRFVLGRRGCRAFCVHGSCRRRRRQDGCGDTHALVTSILAS